MPKRKKPQLKPNDNLSDGEIEKLIEDAPLEDEGELGEFDLKRDPETDPQNDPNTDPKNWETRRRK